MSILMALLTMLAPAFVQGPDVTVLDSQTHQPVANVIITSEDFNAKTGPEGKAGLDGLSAGSTLTFKHSSYQKLSISYAELEKAGFIVYLTPMPVSFERVVISANRFEEDLREVPNKISVISSENAKLQNPQTAADLLATTDEVYVQKSQLGGGSPMIRGFSTNRVLLVVDGVRMNNAIFRSGNLQNVIVLDANAIEGAEVIFGPGSVIYGSDAIGGVMDFHTLAPRYSDNGDLVVHGNAMARYASANSEGTGHFDLSIGGKNWASVTSATYSDYNDLRMGSNGHDEYQRMEYVERINGVDTVLQNDDSDVQKGSAYDQLNFMQKLSFRVSDDLEVIYGLHYSESSDIPRYDRLIEYRSGALRYAEWYYGPQEWLMNNLEFNYTGRNAIWDEAKFVFSQQSYEESRYDRKFGNNWRNERVENVDAVSLNFYLYKSLDESSSLYYGGEYVRDWVGSTGISRNIVTGETEAIDTRYPDGSDWASYATYVNYKNNLSDQVTFVAGGRYSRAKVDAEFDKTFFPFPFDTIDIDTGALTGSLGLIYRPDAATQLNFNFVTGFRAPNIDDAAKVFESAPGLVVVPNGDLSSEYAYSLDATIIRSLLPGVQVEATAFYTILKDAMVRRDFAFNGESYIEYDGELSQVQAIVNADEEKIYGLQIGGSAAIAPRWTLTSNLTVMEGETSDGDPSRHAPPMYGSTHLLYETGKLKVDFYARYNAGISYENLSSSERDKPTIYAADENGNPYCPAWWTLNVKGSYRLSENLELDLGLENILDERYRPYSNGIVAPGINAIVAVRTSF